MMMRAVFFALVAAASLVTLAQADNCPKFPGRKTGCTAATCGHFAVKGKFRYEHSKQISQVAFSRTKYPSVAACCNLCRGITGCQYYNYFVSSKRCRLLNYRACFNNGNFTQLHGGVNLTYATNFNRGASATKANTKFIRYYPRIPNTISGGTCNVADVINDPHLTGASGEAFDFNGLPDKTFCLVSDKDLHINMKLSGYFDDRTEGATAFNEEGKAIRTWIKELGLMWRSRGEEHTILMKARKGANQERGDGFMEEVLVDGVAVPRLALGDELNLYNGQASVAFDSYEKVGPYDVDVYKVRIDGMLVAEVRLRVAHPLLQRPDDAQVHISMDIVDLAYTPTIHGVLGQTYRADREERALNYTTLATLMKTPIAADMESGRGFLDGLPADYVSSDVEVADCKFSQYVQHFPESNDEEETTEEVAMPKRAARTSAVSEAATVSVASA
jgi:hypothetical protein